MCEESGFGTPPISEETERRIELLFGQGEREAVRAILRDECGHNLPFLDRAGSMALERVRIAALKLSAGNFDRLRGAVRLAQTDWRDLLVAAGFADRTDAYGQD
jgi:hypothetical protein